MIKLKKEDAIAVLKRTKKITIFSHVFEKEILVDKKDLIRILKDSSIEELCLYYDPSGLHENSVHVELGT